MRSLPKLLLLSAILPSLALADEAELKDCLAQAGEVAPNAESLALAVSGALAKDKFLHRAYLSPMEYRMLDAKKLAEMLVARLNEECEGPRTKPGAKPVDSEVVMMVNSHNLEAIAKYGFQNQHATASSNGSDAAFDRFKTEQEMVAMELPYGAKLRDVLPKYSAFNLKSANFGSFALPAAYGDMALVFGPSVKKRTTFTFRDSLGSTSRYASGDTSHFPPHTTDFKSPAETDGIKCSGYCEGQIWGPVDFSDVEYLMVKKGSEVPEAAKKLGVPIYEMEAAESRYYGEKTIPIAPEVSAQYKRGELLLAGTGSPARPQAFTKDEMKAAVAAAKPGSPVAKILEGRLLSQMPEAELIEQYASAPTEFEDRFIYGPMRPNVKLLGELATRPLTPAVQKVLLTAVNSKNQLLRREALLGLSDLPPAQLKPILLAALTDRSDYVQTTAVALALDSADPEVLEAVKARFEPEERQYTNTAGYWAYKLWKRKKYCVQD